MDDGTVDDAPVAPADPPARSAAGTVRAYYETLRNGEPLSPYFAEAPTTVKFGVGEQLTGYESVAAGLREQTRTTDGWQVDSRRLVVEERDCHAWFSDDVFMAWTDTEKRVRYEFDTRWSGTLERKDSDAADDTTDDGPAWLFTGMHVSTAVEGR
ncbi:nuclear transport factor 2 family protein [Haloglomus salinum]|jgi:uncharacterized protein YhdP|uniref:nuclear transport factor 2 family protein n=1 Tax=Haloglomus salinum TaxID=2962673 RepID=UPI0020C9872C|nr:nuclear transport factor 2 family protein [Haloglomus salinum]